jgi:hypothetical protein|tara:strand:+ start:3160 stop:3507 length:348 start_codon:yes stop_codon:yes gene_type:complete
MKITRRQIRQVIKEAITTVSDKDFDRITMPGYKGSQPAPGSLPEADEFQNHILAIGLDQAGELVVQDVVDYQSQTKAPRPLEYDEILEIMRDMVDTGMLTDGYGDFFSVHPDYIQ